MSGITGILTTQQQTISATTLQAMTAIIQHRGPDAEGHYISEQIALGYRHFDVHGLTAEQAQTMLHLDRYAVTFDGRIYNLPELQAELSEKGYSFNCESDAQLLAAAYDYWGTDCLNKLNADWAFVIYDTHTQKLFIARDRFGIKPLYYYTDGTSFIFGSEIKAIYASNLVEKAPNETYLKSYLEKGPNEYDAPTAFKNIVRFPFAHYFHGSLQELLHQPALTRYWSLQVNTAREKFDPEKAKQYAQQYYDLLADSVRLRMRGQVKIGAALSGGLDSSSIVYLMHQELKEQGASEPLQTFSSVYKTPGTEHCDESEFINLVANQLGVVSNQIEPKVEDIPTEHEKMIWAMENPPESTCMSSWFSYKNVNRSGFKIILDGQGADELLAGYESLYYSYLLSLSLGEFCTEYTSLIKRKFDLKTFLVFLMFSFKVVFGQKIFNFILFKLGREAYANELNKSLSLMFEDSLVNLMKTMDSESIGNGVVSVMPFTDVRVVEFLFKVPDAYKLRKGWTKYLSRLAFDGKLPNDIVWRKDKQGWPIPEKYWFLNDLNGWFSREVGYTFKEDSPLQVAIRQLNIKTYRNTFGV